MKRAERRRWEAEKWPAWERLVKFKTIILMLPPSRFRRAVYRYSNPRNPEEQQAMINAILADLEGSQR